MDISIYETIERSISQNPRHEVLSLVFGCPHGVRDCLSEKVNYLRLLGPQEALEELKQMPDEDARVIAGQHFKCLRIREPWVSA